MSSNITAKEYLGQVQKLDSRIKRHKLEVMHLCENKYRLASPSLDEKIQHSFNTSAPFENAVDKKLDLEDKIVQEEETLNKLRDQVREAIDLMSNDREQMLLTLRYMLYFGEQDICAEMNIDRSTMYRTAKRALANFHVPNDAIAI